MKLLACLVLLTIAAVNGTANNSSKHAVFMSIALPGHLNPLISQAIALHERNWMVSIVSTHDAKHHISVAAPSFVNWIDLGECYRTEELEYMLNKSSNAVSTSWIQSSWVILSFVNRIHPCFYNSAVAALQTLDIPATVLVSDFATHPAYDVAENLSLPLIINNANLLGMLSPSVLPLNPDLPLLGLHTSIHDLTGFNLLVQRIVLPIFYMVSQIVLTVYVNPQYNFYRAQSGLVAQPMENRLIRSTIMVNDAFPMEYPRLMPPNVYMVGPMFLSKTMRIENDNVSHFDWLSNSWSDNCPIIYVNFGTIAPLNQDQINTLYNAFDRLKYCVSWKLPSKYSKFLSIPLSQNILVRSWFKSQTDILKHSRTEIFISHCGLNSVHESIYMLTPILCIPQLGDQADMAQRVSDSGCGRWISKDGLTSEAVATEIANIAINNDAIVNNCIRIRAAYIHSGGVQKAVDLIEYVSVSKGFEYYTRDYGTTISQLITVDVLAAYIVAGTALYGLLQKLKSLLFTSTRSSKIKDI